MTPFPDYDYEHSPFVLVAGLNSLNYINVKSGYMQPLIDQGIVHREGQQVALFTQIESKDGYYVFFTAFHRDENNQRSDELYCVPLKNDFFTRLRKAGRLPIPTTDAYFQEIEDNNELKKQVEEQEKIIKATGKSEMHSII